MLRGVVWVLFALAVGVVVVVAIFLVTVLVVGVGVIDFLFAVRGRLGFVVRIVGCSLFGAGWDVGGWFRLFRVEVPRVRDLVRGSGTWPCLACSILFGFRVLFRFSLCSPVLFVCATGQRWFMGRAGGIANALRTRNARGAHELYESPARKQG